MRRWLVLLVALSGCLSSTSPDTTDPDPSDPGVRDADLSDVGRWLAPFEGEVPAVNMVLLHDGRILYWSGVEAREGTVAEQTFFTSSPHEGESRILDLSGPSPVVTTPIHPGGAAGDLFCSGQTILADGRVLTAGGTAWKNVTDLDRFFLDGTGDARIFDPATDTWTQVADMTLGRWYPSLLTLPDGTPIAASGIGDLTDFEEHWDSWESYDLAADRWDLMPDTLGHLLPLYPRLHIVPEGAMAGDVFYSTAGTLWGPFGEHPQQAEWSTMQSHSHDGWHEHGRSTFGARQYASSVLLPGGDGDPRVVSFGGSLQQGLLATPFTEIIDLGTEPTTRRGPDMAFPRWNHNSLLLPDGDVLTIGGGLYDNVMIHGQQNVPVLEAERFDADTETWHTLAPMSVPRMYHSSAVLLPDGRILAGGHVPLPNPDPTLRDTVNEQVVETRLEIYEPGYLFRGPRPVIEDAPHALGYGEVFRVDVRSLSLIHI